MGERSPVPKQPADRPHQLLRSLLLLRRLSADHAVIRVVLEQLEGDLVQGGLDRRDLGHHVDAVAVLLDHVLDAPDLPLDAVQAPQYGVLVRGVPADFCCLSCWHHSPLVVKAARLPSYTGRGYMIRLNVAYPPGV